MAVTRAVVRVRTFAAPGVTSPWLSPLLAATPAPSGPAAVLFVGPDARAARGVSSLTASSCGSVPRDPRTAIGLVELYIELRPPVTGLESWTSRMIVLVEAGAPAVSDGCAGARSTRKGRPNPRRPSRYRRTNERTNAFAGRDRRGPAALVAVVAFGSRRLCSRGYVQVPVQVASAGSTCNETCS